MKLRLVASVLLLLLYSSLAAQSLTKEQALEDLQTLVQRIEQYNPALKIYNPHFQKKANELLTSVKTNPHLLDYFSLVSQICALSNEGHFSVGDWQDTIHRGIPNDTYVYLPLSVWVIDGKIFAREVYTKHRVIPRYAEILSINGMSSSDILEQLFKHIPSDGHIVTHLSEKASQGFNWMYYFYVEQPASFEIVYQAMDADDTERVQLPALLRTQQVENYRANKKREPSTEVRLGIHDFYEFTITDNYALLTLKSFDYRLVNKYDLNAKKLYEDLFEQMAEAEVKNLIIDLRHNTGGRNEFADEMVPFILQAEPDKYLKKTISWSGKEKVFKFPKQDRRAFSGQILVLVNGMTYSAGASLARYLKEYGQATIIGQETGTRYEGFAAGSSEIIQLPHAQIKIGIPRYHILYPPSKIQTTTNRGLIPDVVLFNHPSDIEQGKDRVLEKAIEMAEQKKTGE